MADTFVFGENFEEDLAIGYGTVPGITLPDGSVQTLHQIGLHSFLTPIAFSALPGSPVEGMVAAITDSNTQTWGATVAGGGAFHILAYYDGTHWTVIAK